MWSAPFDELLLEQPRPDAEMPMHLPMAPPPHSAWLPPKKIGPPGSDDDEHDDDEDDDDEDDDRRRLATGGAGLDPTPQHCGSAERKCRGAGRLSVKQERLIRHYAELTGVIQASPHVIRRLF
jgi:hypothetical protein